MKNTKEFMFFSLAFAFGLLIYTLLLIVLYYLFLSSESEDNEEGTSVAVNSSSEKLTDLNEVNFLEDVEEEKI